MVQADDTGRVHSHGLFYGRTLHQDALQEEWHWLNGATEVHRDLLKGGEEGVARWVRYSMEFGDAPPEIRADVATQLKGRRWVEWLGSFRKARAQIRDQAEQTLPLDPAAWPLEWQEIYDERAAILQFDGGLLQHEAERHAEEIVRATYIHHT